MPCCHDSCCPSSVSPSTGRDDRHWHRALWVALIVNGGFFLTEIIAAVMAGSPSLQADALDFFGDTANYAISLTVTGMALAWRSRAAMLKGVTMLVFALWVLGNTLWHAWSGTVPHAETMGLIGALALLANGGVALMLYRFRSGDANMRSVWICSRNDAIGNLAVVLAALGVFGTGTGWPDIIVAFIMGGLGLHGGAQIVRHARMETASVKMGLAG
ncbi:cation transporter [Gluconobacter sp. Dm-74]|uniref:cation transporter n=1 Tax=Gluconobacter sp. Dm-74 TaxID=2799803 RepID=UPI001B8C82F9|nr:cation transporter [Gluconobacter sp. Dm-74]MBS1092923.1 cation transporter [Gluconobacter sp. Dm-74]